MSKDHIVQQLRDIYKTLVELRNDSMFLSEDIETFLQQNTDDSSLNQFPNLLQDMEDSLSNYIYNMDTAISSNARLNVTELARYAIESAHAECVKWRDHHTDPSKKKYWGERVTYYESVLKIF